MRSIGLAQAFGQLRDLASAFNHANPIWRHAGGIREEFGKTLPRGFA
ncbi:MAG: hypothetical protein PHE55_18030 [Methylococcaceae bacterium]|nr:hypothetical protein [Methylococcaceae bacterium]